MKKYTRLCLLLFLIYGGGVLFQLYQATLSDDTARELSYRKRIFPTAEHFSNKSGPLRHYKAYAVAPETKLKELIGAVFVTTDVTPKVSGYAGPIKLLVGVDTSGVIAGTEILSHNETPAYVAGMEDYVAQLRGKTVNAPFQLGKDLDGISRATMTSQAIADSVQRGGRRIAQEILNVPVSAPLISVKPLRMDHILLTALLFIIAITGALKNDARWRWTALIGGLIYFGFIESTMVSTVQFVNLGLGKIPLFSDHPLWYCLIGLNLLSLFLVGNVYCGSLCPFAGLQEILYRITGPLRPKNITVDHRLLSQAHLLKYLVLFVLLVLCFATGKADPANVEVFVLLFSFNATFLGWIFIATMLLLSVFHYRFWCRYLCPMGALNGLLARFSLYKIRLDDGCGGCEACARLCPTSAIDMRADVPIIQHEECILCGKCMHKCPKGIMHIKIPMQTTGAAGDKKK